MDRGGRKSTKSQWMLHWRSATNILWLQTNGEPANRSPSIFGCLAKGVAEVTGSCLVAAHHTSQETLSVSPVAQLHSNLLLCVIGCCSVSIGSQSEREIAEHHTSLFPMLVVFSASSTHDLTWAPGYEV